MADVPENPVTSEHPTDGRRLMMTAEEFAELIQQLIIEAQREGVSREERIATLQGVLDALRVTSSEDDPELG